MDETRNYSQSDEKGISQSAFWGTIALSGIALLVYAYFFTFLLQQPKTPVVYIALTVFLFSFVSALTSIALTMRGRQDLGVKLGFYTLFIMGITITSVFQGRAQTASLTILVISIIEIMWLLPSQSRRWYYGVTAAAMIMMWAVEWINPSWRVTIAAARVGPAAVIVFAVILGVVATAQAWKSLSLRWKMGAMVAVLFLAMTGVAAAGSSGLQSLRYQISNIYDFMLVPIVAINNADSALADAQFKLENLDEVGEAEAAPDIAAIAASNKLAGDVIQQYDTEWVTTVSPEFTQALREAGKLALQQQELEALAKLHTEFDSYLVISNQYIQSIQAGQPNNDLAKSAGQSLQASRAALHELIDVNNQYAAFSNLEAQNSYQRAFISGAATLGIGLALGLLVSYLIVISITTRLNNLTQFAGAVREGKLEQRLAVTWNDEIALLGTAFNEMTSKLQESFATLGQRVADRTRNLELAAEVGRAVSQVRSLDVMLKDACELILKEFNLYYVQVYLTDASGSTLKLEAGTGNMGAQLVGRGHNLPLDTGSINGRAATEKRSVVIADTAQSATFRQNPLLPETRGEMAVPLIVADKVVGVLDMQSAKPGVLTEEVRPAFEALAGQLAVAVQNANLLAETEQARAQVEAQARRLVREGWNGYLDAIHEPEQLGFVFDHNKVSPLADAGESRFAENSFAVSTPISVTGEPLGSLVVEIDDEAQREQTSELVNIVARQVAQQIENLRLLESAERYRYEAEEASRRLTREGWKTYMESGSGKLGYMYNLNEVVPVEADRAASENAVTLPIKVRDEAVGKLALIDIDENDSQSLELANVVAERLAIHIESLRQFDQTQSALAQSERLFEASRNLNQAKGLQELMTATINTLNVPDVVRATLMTFDYNSVGEVERQTVVANWWSGTGHEATPIGTQYSAEMLKSMPLTLSPRPVFFNDLLNDERLDAGARELIKESNVRAIAALPLHTAAGQIGVLTLESEVLHVFTSEETRLFESLAPQIATVLENRRQFEHAQEQAKREAMLNVINQKIQSATSVEAVLQIAARELGHALSAPLTIAQLGMAAKEKVPANGNGNGNGNGH